MKPFDIGRFGIVGREESEIQRKGVIQRKKLSSGISSSEIIVQRNHVEDMPFGDAKV